MGCLTENTIVALFDASLSQDETARVDEHVASCDACRELVARYASVVVSESGRPPDKPREDESVVSVASPAGEGHEPISDIARRVALARASERLGMVIRGKWKIERLLGIGGMAQVFEATHRNGRKAALKLMRPDLTTDSSFIERFLREGYIANRIQHPGAVAILDDDLTDDGVPYLVMDLLRGQALGQRLRDHGPLGMDEALRVIDQTLDVLAAAHDRHIIHRDIKPDNLFETESGEIKVLDFGIARLRDAIVTGGFRTGTGTTMGTPGYMSPEQARGLKDIDARSDLWSVGATLYSLLTNRRLHESSSHNQSLLSAMTTVIPPVARILSDVDPSICALLDRALAFDKEERFEDARAMQNSIRAIPTKAREVPPRTSLKPAASASAVPAKISDAPTLPGLSPGLPNQAASSATNPMVVSSSIAGISRQRRRVLLYGGVGAAGVGGLFLVWLLSHPAPSEAGRSAPAAPAAIGSIPSALPDRPTSASTPALASFVGASPSFALPSTSQTAVSRPTGSTSLGRPPVPTGKPPVPTGKPSVPTGKPPPPTGSASDPLDKQ